VGGKEEDPLERQGGMVSNHYGGGVQNFPRGKGNGKKTGGRKGGWNPQYFGIKRGASFPEEEHITGRGKKTKTTWPDEKRQTENPVEGEPRLKKQLKKMQTHPHGRRKPKLRTVERGNVPALRKQFSQSVKRERLKKKHGGVKNFGRRNSACQGESPQAAVQRQKKVGTDNPKGEHNQREQGSSKKEGTFGPQEPKAGPDRRPPLKAQTQLHLKRKAGGHI